MAGRINAQKWRDVAELAVSKKNQEHPTVLVTGNIDLFTEVVVPDLDLDEMFTVIVNSADHRETRKDLLWPIAFDGLREDIGYSDRLLIEYHQGNVDLFHSLGGQDYRYTDDAALSEWLTEANL